MKRFVSIATIAVVILAITAGPAFASACATMECGPVIACAMTASPTCPMSNGKAVFHDSCVHPTERAVREGVVSDPTPHHAMAALPAVALPIPVLRCTGSVASLAPDARGAPHLTAVLRL